MWHGITPALAAYAVIGPLAWGFILFGLANAHARMGKMKRAHPPLRHPAPPVALLIPAHNEAAGIDACLRSALAQDYPHFRIIAINDRSTDATGQAMDAVAASAPSRLEILHLTEKPQGWMGKCHALHAGSARIGTEPWIFFVDSDVTLAPHALSRAVAQAQDRGLDALSILTRQRCDTFAERLLVPISCAAVLAMYMASHTNNDNRKTAFANGQFFLIRTDAYRKVGGHACVANEGVEDVRLMQALKSSGAKCRLYSGDDLAETRMYSSIPAMFKGWARIYSRASDRRPWRILVGSAFILSGLAAFPAWALAATHGWRWETLALLHLALVLTCTSLMYRWSRNPPWLALLFPAAALMQLAFYAYALSWCTTNRFEWRGQSYPPPQPPTTPQRKTPP